ncbi:bifunctional isocitrate dehydrogenase kinase/phosphatase [Suttonella sp. R2A3]|uniref:bifunctional isocitrate dehydrogenase kinase/phosphatase n=1 Tax=Suttonella sp. R2A3 TaxID=2908648 RepID=UPI001F30F292|nr:bifunctional isocitrate dehydrogenase kinase/phosphatase [Suttonella sp. R2A3]UJF24359.1 bifunctional isocitrate dehydrogenase kinase/phosphatase [Suttonella sp. R2A3]
MPIQQCAEHIAHVLLSGFDRHHRIFTEYNRRAAQHFHDQSWLAAKQDAREQVDLYDERVRECVNILREEEDINELDETLWPKVKRHYINLLYNHLQPELAESFFNSVFCKLFNRRYYNNQYIFFHQAINTQHIECEQPDYRAYYPEQTGMNEEIRRLLEELPLDLPFADIERDIANIASVVDLTLEQKHHSSHLQLQILTPIFYRNKGAYVVGRILNNARKTPLVIAVLQNAQGECYVDAVLTNPDDVSHIFSFTRAYFKVDFPVPSVLVQFMQSILPTKNLADLYTAIGFHKQGKNEFYRAFLYHLRHSSDSFIIAPGEEGMVMMVFTLPSYPYVFKIIKDKFHPNKKVTHALVKQRYHLIKQLDRVGRMADTWQFSYVAFPRDRFNDELLEKIEATCAENIIHEDDKIVINHLYIERRMTPLNLYLRDLDTEHSAKILKDYGKAIEEIAAAGIFPGDLLLKNFGVTRHERIVFYDYDEIVPIEECRFRRIPPPRTPEQEMASEPWYSIGENDVFPEEFRSFLLNTETLRHTFSKDFPHLMRADYWQDVQNRINDGELLDVYPYDDRRRFSIPTGESL